MKFFLLLTLLPYFVHSFSGGEFAVSGISRYTDQDVNHTAYIVAYQYSNPDYPFTYLNETVSLLAPYNDLRFEKQEEKVLDSTVSLFYFNPQDFLESWDGEGVDIITNRAPILHLFLKEFGTDTGLYYINLNGTLIRFNLIQRTTHYVAQLYDPAFDFAFVVTYYEDDIFYGASSLGIVRYNIVTQQYKTVVDWRIIDDHAAFGNQFNLFVDSDSIWFQYYTLVPSNSVFARYINDETLFPYNTSNIVYTFEDMSSRRFVDITEGVDLRTFWVLHEDYVANNSQISVLEVNLDYSISFKQSITLDLTGVNSISAVPNYYVFPTQNKKIVPLIVGIGVGVLLILIAGSIILWKIIMNRKHSHSVATMSRISIKEEEEKFLMKEDGEHEDFD